MSSSRSYYVPSSIREHLPTLHRLTIHLMPTRPRNVHKVVRKGDTSTVYAVTDDGKVYGNKATNGCYMIFNKHGHIPIKDFELLNEIGVIPDEEIEFLHKFIEDYQEPEQQLESVRYAIRSMERAGLAIHQELLNQVSELESKIPPFDEWAKQFNEEEEQ